MCVLCAVVDENNFKAIAVRCARARFFIVVKTRRRRRRSVGTVSTQARIDMPGIRQLVPIPAGAISGYANGHHASNSSHPNPLACPLALRACSKRVGETSVRIVATGCRVWIVLGNPVEASFHYPPQKRRLSSSSHRQRQRAVVDVVDGKRYFPFMRCVERRL